MKTRPLINSKLKDEQLKPSQKLDDMLQASSEKVLALANIHVVNRFFPQLKLVTTDNANKKHAYPQIRKA